VALLHSFLLIPLPSFIPHIFYLVCVSVEENGKWTVVHLVEPQELWEKQVWTAHIYSDNCDTANDLAISPCTKAGFTCSTSPEFRMPLSDSFSLMCCEISSSDSDLKPKAHNRIFPRLQSWGK
jgi:hypothetical protein